MYMCPACGWTGNKTELEENLSCPDCESLEVALADSLDFVPVEQDTSYGHVENIEDTVLEENYTTDDPEPLV